MATSTIPNYRSGLVKANGANEIYYIERTTRNGHCDAFNVNPNSLKYGYLSLLKIGKQVIIHISGVTSKSSGDWIIDMNTGYIPFYTEQFRYMLGSTECAGHINGNGVSNPGLVFFDTLNTTDVLSATICFNLS